MFRMGFFVSPGISTEINDTSYGMRPSQSVVGECLLPMDVGTVEGFDSAQNQAESSDSVASLPGKFRFLYVFC